MPPEPLPSGFTLRRAGCADAARLAALAARTFTDTFGHLYPADDLASFLAQTCTDAAYRALLSAPGHAIWLLEQDGTPVGHAEAGPCKLPHPDVAADDGELRRLYVIAPLQGRGLGAHLMQAAMDWLLRSGPRSLWLGVWSENLGAQRFYTRYGFYQAGQYQFAVGRMRDRELIFTRPAPSSQYPHHPEPDPRIGGLHRCRSAP